jgi:CMP-N-acetylneuraminic acid synthetase
LSQKRVCNVLTVADTGFTFPHLRTLGGDGVMRSLGGETVYNFQTQDSPYVYGLVGVAQCAPVADFLKHRTFQYGSPVGYVVDKFEAADIDTPEDLSWAEMLAKNWEN